VRIGVSDRSTLAEIPIDVDNALRAHPDDRPEIVRTFPRNHSRPRRHGLLARFARSLGVTLA